MKLRILTWDPSLRREQQDAANEARVQSVINNYAESGWTLVDQHVTGGTGVLPQFFLWFRKEE